MDGEMPHHGWRIGRGSLETVQAERLTADRLASLMSFLGSAYPDSTVASQSPAASEHPVQAEQPTTTDTPARTPDGSMSDETSPWGDPPPAFQTPGVVDAAFAQGAVVDSTVVGVIVADPVVVDPTLLDPCAPDAALADASVPPDVTPDDAEADLTPSVTAPAAQTRAGPKPGRHRAPKPTLLSVRAFSLTGRRLALLVSVTTLVAVTAFLALT